ncbi:hypothetical protein ABID16_003399 [Rhizobium aquaticum]|uniref:Formyl transferase N-terminal domain-containing protein n=1 Tax=Rhizobium aquaticum TaxID=1549636 RepID=A0ABV2J415_9HYPH
MKIVVLTNNDLTGNLIFSELFNALGINIEAVFFSKSPVKKKDNVVAAALSLLKRMDVRYWLFLVVTNGFFSIYSNLTSFFRLTPAFGPLRDLKALSLVRNVKLFSSINFNDKETKEILRALEPDLLLIRVSTILDAEILSIPKLGTWCVHSSLLPAYGGIAGEFQALREGRLSLGSTVFKVTVKLDEGPPLAQVAFESDPKASLFWHIVENNRRAGQLLSEMVSNLALGNPPDKPLLNQGLEPSYYSWPDASQVDEFLATRRPLLGFFNFLLLLAASMRIVRPKFR